MSDHFSLLEVGKEKEKRKRKRANLGIKRIVVAREVWIGRHVKGMGRANWER